MSEKSRSHKLVDYIFWFLFLVYTNPGAILEAVFKEDSGDGGINIVDFVFVLMFVCYVFIFYKKDIYTDKTYLKTLQNIIYFVLYLMIVFGFLVPIFKETNNSSFVSMFIKSRTTIFNMFFFIMIYRFFLRSYMIFLKLFVFSSILIISLFLASVISGIDILPIETAKRGFIKIDRIFLKQYGIMPILIPLGCVVIVFKSKIKLKRIILIGFGLMFVVWLVSLTRRHIIGTIIYLLFGLIYYNYFQHKPLISLSRVVSVIFYSALIGGFIYFTFPKYINAGIVSMQETVNVLLIGETSTGAKDQRLGLGKKFIVDKFKENPIFGTGFDNRWRISAGDKAGFEALDYPFIAALAMTGISGILFFLPIYIILIKALLSDIKFMRKNKMDFSNIYFFFMMNFIIYFSFNLIQYMNWFSPVSNQTSYEFYVYLAMYLASRKLFYTSIMENVVLAKDLLPAEDKASDK